MACSVNYDTIRNGIVKAVQEDVEATGIFQKEGEVYTPIAQGWEEAAERINNEWEDDVFSQVGDEANFIIGEPSTMLVNRYMFPLLQEEQTLGNSKEQAAFTDLQKRGIITGDYITVDGIDYYKLKGGKNEDVRGRFETIVRSKGIDFLHITETAEDYLVQVGRKEKLVKPIEEEDTEVAETKISPITKARVLRFLDNIGFTNLDIVKDLVHNGEKLNANAFIDFAKGTMQIVEGQEDYVLPEEAMHILVELLKENNQPLYSMMRSEIVNYKMYRDLVGDPNYIETNRKLYSKPDGTLDYDKLKDEAIAKLLAEHLSNNLEGSNESTKRLQTAQSMFDQFIQWIKNLFGKYKNPFKEAIEALEHDDRTFGEFADIRSKDIFLAAKSVKQRDQEHANNREIFERIRNKATQAGVSKVESKEENAYYKDGVRVPDSKRISAKVDAHYKKLFGNRNFSEEEQKFYDVSRDDGSRIHKMIEKIIDAFVDSKTGLLKSTPSMISMALNGPVEEAMAEELTDYLETLLTKYPEGTRFITEQVIYDSKADRYGTIDFQAVQPDGTVDILDWKSMLLQDLEEAKDYKKQGIFIQINDYAQILRDEYGVEKIGKIRAIPIQKHYRKDEKGDVAIRGISIAHVDPSKIPQSDAYLRPLISPQETTGSEKKDKLVKKLEALYQQYFDKGYFQTNKTVLDNLKDAIFQIRTSNSVDNLSNYFAELETKLQDLRKGIPKMVDANTQDINEVLALVAFYRDINTTVVKPTVFLQKDPTIDQKSRNKLFKAATQLEFLMDELDESVKVLVNKQAEKQGIFGLLLPEKVVNLARRYFRAMGSQNIATIRYMYELTKKAYGRIDLSTNKDLNRLKDIKYKFTEWAKGNNLSEKDALGKLVDFENGKLHSKIDASFFEKRTEIVKLRDKKKTLQFVKDNYDLTAYNEWYKKALEENKAIWATATYDEDVEINARIKRQNLARFEQSYNITKHPVTAYGAHNRQVWSQNIKEEKWQSAAYKELTAPGNEPLLAAYNYMIEKNQQLVDVGAIKDFQKYTFMPNVRKDLATIVMDADMNIMEKGGTALMNSLKDWRASITVEDYELNYKGALDPLTGEKLGKRFVPFVNRIDPEERSFDLFTIYGLMTKEVYKEQYLSENDEMLRALLHIEKNKTTLQQNKYGKIATDPGGKPMESLELGKNSGIAEEYVKAIANGEKLQYDADATVQFRFKETWNKLPIGKMLKFDINPETYNPTTVSLTKFLLWANTANQRRVLGINLASAISNLFGGTFSANRLYQKYASKEDLTKAWTKMTSGAFYQSDEMKKNAALTDYFLPLLSNRESYKSSQLSVNQASRILSQEWLMSPMRKTSEIVQLNIFMAVMDNTGLVNGKLVNLRDALAKELNYENRYSLNPSERATLENTFNEKLKEWKAKYSLAKTAQFKTIQEAGKDKTIIEIPGYDREGPEVAEIRDIIQTMSKDALGEADEFDLAPYKFSIWWRLFMTFKNWIPRQADVRVGEFRYDQAHNAYEYGRFRMFARAFSANYAKTILQFVPLPYLTGKVTNAVFGKEDIINKARSVYLEKMAEAKRMGTFNPTTFISEGEFIDKFIQGTEATFAEIRTMTLMMLLLFSGMAGADDDDDSETKAYKALMRKQINKLQDEVGFFYSPKSFIDIGGGGLPMFSFVKDAWYFGSDVTEQFFGFTFEQVGLDEQGLEMQEHAKPIKRTFKMIPALKEILTYLPAIDETTSKEWGVRINDRRAF